MQGRRRPDGTSPHELDPGDYARYKGSWFARIPNGDLMLHANLANHAVVENDDGTITVSPSILCDGDLNGRWHGFLECGVWREC